ncbi:MAG: hypothetical protein KJZ70_13715 [Bryobacterales bacterium]|nr:hypothetical protein [Bryobacterales bacterium]
MFERDANPHRRLAVWSPALAALGVGFLAAWLVIPWMPTERLDIAEAFGRCLGIVLVPFLASLLAASIAFRLLGPPGVLNPAEIGIALAASATWFAPFLLTAWDGAIWHLPIAIVIGAMAARLIGHYERGVAHGGDPTEDREEWMDRLAHEMFSGLREVRRSPWKREALAAALFIECGIAAMTFGYIAPGTLSVACGGILVGWSTRHALESRPADIFRRGSAYASVAGALASLALIATFGEPPLYPGIPGDGGGDNGRQGQALADKDLVGSFILRSEDLRKAVLLVPPKSRVSPLLRLGRREMRIPFTGEYWFYPWPRRSPGKDAVAQWGSPLGWVFTNMEKSPIQMRARQSFAVPIPLECCGAIAITIAALPAETDTVSIEATLLRHDATHRANRAYLGKIHLTPAAFRSGVDAGKPVTETLRFAVPKDSPISDFDTIDVVFDLHSPRVHRSAKAEVEAFTFLP